MARVRRPGFAETLKQGWKPPQRRGQAARGRPAAGPKNGAGAAANGTASSGAEAELDKRRSELSGRFAELQWDLGGMAYEMASRDHYRLDVLNKQAARLQEIDAELGQIEHVLKLDQAGASGACPGCGALHARGALFCWRCGKELQPGAKGSEQG